MRIFFWTLTCVAVSGCYLSHEIPEDSAVAACAPPPRRAATIEIEIVDTMPEGCAREGWTYQIEADLGGGPLFADCPDSRTTLTDDGCGLTIEATCLGVEYERILHGELRGPEGRGTIEADMRVGYAHAECQRVEAWRLAD
jgi:hypothetical protein